MSWRALQVVNVLEADPDLADDLDNSRALAASRRASAEIVRVSIGPWCPEDAGGFGGLLILDGLVTHRLALGTRRSIELLGRGDFIQSHGRDANHRVVPADTSWAVVEPVQFAVLDGRFFRSMAEYPEVFARLLSRATERARTLSLRLAIAQVPKLTTRLHFLLWHLAERFGRVEPGGVILPLQLSHGTLAELVCAQRPSVSVALKELQRQGVVARIAGGEWRLAGPEPAAWTAVPAHPRAIAA